MIPKYRHWANPMNEAEIAEWLKIKATRLSNGCLVCHLAHKGGGGHRRIKIKGKSHYAHRLIFSVANGPIPEGYSVIHSCDNSRCIEITHLRLGTQLDNMRDRSRRGRFANQWRHFDETA